MSRAALLGTACMHVQEGNVMTAADSTAFGLQTPDQASALHVGCTRDCSKQHSFQSAQFRLGCDALAHCM